MKAILIDPKERTISEVDYDGDWRNISKLIDCDLFSCVYIPKDDSIYVDDEGLYRENQSFFKWSTYDSPLAGKALILGTNDEGESIACTHTVEEVKQNVKWMVYIK